MPPPHSDLAARIGDRQNQGRKASYYEQGRGQKRYYDVDHPRHAASGSLLQRMSPVTPKNGSEDMSISPVREDSSSPGKLSLLERISGRDSTQNVEGEVESVFLAVKTSSSDSVSVSFV